MMPLQSVLNAIIIEVARRFLDNETILESTNNSLTLSFSLCQNQVDTDSQKCGQLQCTDDAEYMYKRNAYEPHPSSINIA